ncbi:MAG: hypothetical protein DSM106950_20465 [Stigonema ocellatum SAG 48.90 = DSM 106950]|nr:hypothetical protein [Stigonema ocellatum SAG 48.90 = DSM 106950]
MRYLIDTNVCVKYLNGEPIALQRRLQATDLEDIAVCSTEIRPCSIAQQPTTTNH